MFLLAKTSFDDDDAQHERLLQAVYRVLTGDKRNCPRYGRHWEDIGFQGNDPATDLRDAGMLGLLHMLYFAENHFDEARRIHLLAKDPFQNFPLMATSLNMTLIAMRALRDGRLFRSANRSGSPLLAAAELYMALFHRMYERWKGENLTIARFGHVLQDLKVEAQKDADGLVAGFKEAMARMKRRTQGGGGGAAGMEFLNAEAQEKHRKNGGSAGATAAGGGGGASKYTV